MIDLNKISHEVLNIYNSIIRDDYLEDRYEYTVEELAPTYGINEEDAEILFSLIRANFQGDRGKGLKPINHYLGRKMAGLLVRIHSEEEQSAQEMVQDFITLFSHTHPDREIFIDY